ncbi:hypothetical protein SAMN05660642_01545 [Geodermatophilus siccatus]|uniref:Lipoprotein n=1 Tax=Geodermatophilus siccatus TaxID=1137991 RepID=A0A1G9Q881_9ACTN|nr:hypothetical protein SAMN05660642_01545 [Geodermatophilus siccatus]
MRKSNCTPVTGVLRWGAVLVAVTSAACHVLALTSGPTPSSVHVVVLLAMGMGCLPCAMHLAVLPRRRAWAQMAVVSAAVLAGHPVLSAASGAAHHAPAVSAGGRALDVALVVGPVVGLVLAVAGLVLGRTPAAAPPRLRSPGQPCARTCSVTSSETRPGASSGRKWGTPSSTSSR